MVSAVNIFQSKTKNVWFWSLGLFHLCCKIMGLLVANPKKNASLVALLFFLHFCSQNGILEKDRDRAFQRCDFHLINSSSKKYSLQRSLSLKICFKECYLSFLLLASSKVYDLLSSIVSCIYKFLWAFCFFKIYLYFTYQSLLYNFLVTP